MVPDCWERGRPVSIETENCADLELSRPHVPCVNAVIMWRREFARHDLPTVKTLSPNISHSLGYFCVSLCELPRSVCALHAVAQWWKPLFFPLFLNWRKQFQIRTMWRRMWVRDAGKYQRSSVFKAVTRSWTEGSRFLKLHCNPQVEQKQGPLSPWLFLFQQVL